MEDKGNNIVLSDVIVQHNKRAFLLAYAECGTITRAAELAGIARSTHYEWLSNDMDYAKACADAYNQSGERLEQEARRRAVEGVAKPVFFQGQIVGHTTEYSDTLLIFLLKGAMPDKYKENNRMDITIQPAQPGDVVSLRELRDIFETAKGQPAEIIDAEVVDAEGK